MLRQEELPCIKAISNTELSPVFLRELMDAVAAGKKALAATEASAASGSAVERPSGVGGEARTSRDSADPCQQEET